jgi:hypothetical protein
MAMVIMTAHKWFPSLPITFRVATEGKFVVGEIPNKFDRTRIGHFESLKLTPFLGFIEQFSVVRSSTTVSSLSQFSVPITLFERSANITIRSNLISDILVDFANG